MTRYRIIPVLFQGEFRYQIQKKVLFFWIDIVWFYRNEDDARATILHLSQPIKEIVV